MNWLLSKQKQNASISIFVILMTSILAYRWMKQRHTDDLYDLINCFENDKDPVAFDIDQDDELHISLPH